MTDPPSLRAMLASAAVVEASFRYPVAMKWALALGRTYPEGAPRKSRMAQVTHALADQQVAEEGGMSKETANSLAGSTGNRQDYSIAPTGH
jgi:hypothetical protein